MRDDFASLLRTYREAAMRSRNNLAHEVGVDPSYLTRIEHGDREPPREHIVTGLARALRLSPIERNRLLLSAGYAPLALTQIGTWSDALEAVAGVLSDVRLSPDDRAEFERVITSIAARWKPIGATNGHRLPTVVPPRPATTLDLADPLERLR